MAQTIQERHEKVRRALTDAGAGLSPEEWIDLLEEVSADVEGYLDAAKEEGKEAG